MTLPIIIILILLLSVLIFYGFVLKKDKWLLPNQPFLPDWRVILERHINFYNALNQKEKTFFEYRVQEFLLNHRITGIKVDIDIKDKLLVASSAVIPIFKFPKWRYNNLYEVLLYPAMFNDRFETEGGGRNILGMVGTGYMQGKMILSKPALHHGFDNDSDKRNTAVHEFIHLIDMSDGVIDGIPSLLLDQPNVIPWLEMIELKMEEIYAEKSDINPYGGKNVVEFFAVAGEYFFERPQLLAKKHPELYDVLEEIFDHDMEKRDLGREKMEIGRNSPCPCNSGEKFKHCCGKVHFS